MVNSHKRTLNDRAINLITLCQCGEKLWGVKKAKAETHEPVCVGMSGVDMHIECG